ncbi:hypothetical protein D3C72_1941150 [compost metagenome]
MHFCSITASNTGLKKPVIERLFWTSVQTTGQCLFRWSKTPMAGASTRRPAVPKSVHVELAATSLTRCNRCWPITMPRWTTRQWTVTVTAPSNTHRKSSAPKASTTDSTGQTTAAARSARSGLRSAEPLPTKNGAATAFASLKARALRRPVAPITISSATR